MDSPIVYDEVFKRLLDAGGLTESEFAELYKELIANNARVDLTNKTADEATMENCTSGITWLKTRLPEQKWQSFAAVMSILAIVMSEAQAAAVVSGDILSQDMPS